MLLKCAAPWTAAACCRCYWRSLLRLDTAKVESIVSSPASRLASQQRQQAAAIHGGFATFTSCTAAKSAGYPRYALMRIVVFRSPLPFLSLALCWAFGSPCLHADVVTGAYDMASVRDTSTLEPR